jgi:hypothetical protein
MMRTVWLATTCLAVLGGNRSRARIASDRAIHSARPNDSSAGQDENHQPTLARSKRYNLIGRKIQTTQENGGY